MTNMPFDGPADFRDIESLNHFAAATAAGDEPDAVLAALRVRSRDNARTPMQWDGSAAAGFSTGTPWIGVNPNYPEINAAAQLDDSDSVLAHYRAVIDLRHTDPVVAHGDFTMLLPTDQRVYAFTRSWHGSTLLVLGNFSAEQAPAAVPDEAAWAQAELVLGNYPAQDQGEQGTLVLRPWESRIYRRTG
jgi:oligo-1,6-glucosidase